MLENIAKAIGFVVVVATIVTGCASTVETPEQTVASTDEALPKCDPELGGCTPKPPVYSCGQTCCYSGGRDFNASDPVSGVFENALKTLGCSRPIAVGKDGAGKWWFGTTCDHGATLGPWLDAVMSSGSATQAKAYEGSNACMYEAGAGYMNVIWDPTCPGGCAQLPNRRVDL